MYVNHGQNWRDIKTEDCKDFNLVLGFRFEHVSANLAVTYPKTERCLRIRLRQRSLTNFFFSWKIFPLQVLILVSDGRQSKDPGYYPLPTAIKPLQAQRVKILAVGFGDNVNTSDLKVITGSNDHILSEQETGNIDRLQRELVSKACIV